MDALFEDPLEASLESNLQRDFCTTRSLRDLLWQQYFIIRNYLGGFDQLRGKSLLDLGCGSGASPEGGCLARDERWYEPWLCRTAMHLGTATGIDLEEKGIDDIYEHITADLTEVDVSALLRGRKFDVVFNTRFVPSQKFNRRDKSISARLMEKFEQPGNKVDELHRELGARLRAGVASILSQKGVYFEGDEVWKKDGELVSQGSWHRLEN